MSVLAQHARPVTLAGEQTLPVLDALRGLFPDEGLRRGTTLAVGGSPGAGTTSLALGLAVAASQAGSWVAAVGLPSLGLATAAELGLALDRLALVASPGVATWATVLATLVDALDVVITALPTRLGASDARRLVARARERGSVLVAVGAPARALDLLGPEIRLAVHTPRWEGIGSGHGHLRARRVVVEATGRRAAARPRQIELWLPSATGAITQVATSSPVSRRGVA